jgi:hypothetical protein
MKRTHNEFVLRHDLSQEQIEPFGHYMHVHNLYVNKEHVGFACRRLAFGALYAVHRVRIDPTTGEGFLAEAVTPAIFGTVTEALATVPALVEKRQLRPLPDQVRSFKASSLAYSVLMEKLDGSRQG